MKRSSNALKSTQPPSTYEIFSTMGGVVKRKKYVAPVALHPLRLVNKSADLFRLLVATYLKNFSQDTGRSSLPVQKHHTCKVNTNDSLVGSVLQQG